MLRIAAATILFCAPIALLAIPGDIVLPIAPVITEPDPPPTPRPEIQPIDKLAAGQWYVIESTSELIALQSPEGVVDIDVVAGPIKARGIFVDGVPGKTETRTFSSPFVYFVSAKLPGKVELILIPIGVSQASDIVRHVLTVSGVGPQPPPPTPSPDPEPDPTPQPVTPTKIQVVIIEDPTLRAALPAEQIVIMDGGDVRDYVKTHCTLTENHPDFRKLSVRQDVSNQPAWISEAFAEPRTSLPWIVIVTPTKRISGALPETVAETMALLKTYGGP